MEFSITLNAKTSREDVLIATILAMKYTDVSVVYQAVKLTKV